MQIFIRGEILIATYHIIDFNNFTYAGYKYWVKIIKLQMHGDEL